MAKGKVSELFVDVRARADQFRQDMRQVRQTALREAAEIERGIEGRLQRKLTRGEQVRSALGTGATGIARGAGVAGAAAAAAFAGFRVGNAIEGLISLPSQVREEERTRRESLTTQFQQSFIRQQAARNVNLPSASRIREQFRQQRASLLIQREKEIDAGLNAQNFSGRGPLEGIRAILGFLPTNALTSPAQGAVFASQDVRRARETGLNVFDVREDRLRREQRGLTQSQIGELDIAEEEAIRAALRQAFPALQTQFQAQGNVELLNELKRLNEKSQAPLGAQN